jgi:hypothetical protein
MYVSSYFPMTKPVIIIREQAVEQLECVLATVDHILWSDALDHSQIIRSQMNTIATCDELHPESVIDWRVRNCYPYATHTEQRAYYMTLGDHALPAHEISLVADMLVSLVEQGLHYHYVKQWYDYFGSNVHVMELEQLVTNPETTRRELEDYLGFTLESQTVPGTKTQHTCKMSNPLPATLRTELKTFYAASNLALRDLVSNNANFALHSSKMKDE